MPGSGDAAGVEWAVGQVALVGVSAWDGPARRRTAGTALTTPTMTLNAHVVPPFAPCASTPLAAAASEKKVPVAASLDIRMRTNQSGYDCCEGGGRAGGFAAASLKDHEADQRWSSVLSMEREERNGPQSLQVGGVSKAVQAVLAL